MHFPWGADSFLRPFGVILVQAIFDPFANRPAALKVRLYAVSGRCPEVPRRRQFRPVRVGVAREVE